MAIMSEQEREQFWEDVAQGNCAALAVLTLRPFARSFNSETCGGEDIHRADSDRASEALLAKWREWRAVTGRST